MCFLQFLAENYKSYLICVKTTYVPLPPFGHHKHLLNSNVVSNLISTAAESIVLSFDTPYYTKLTPYYPKTEIENWNNIDHSRGSSFVLSHIIDEKPHYYCKGQGLPLG